MGQPRNRMGGEGSVGDSSQGKILTAGCPLARPTAPCRGPLFLSLTRGAYSQEVATPARGPERRGREGGALGEVSPRREGFQLGS